MIIDTHTHIGKMLNFNMKTEDLLYSMEKYGIDMGKDWTVSFEQA